MERTDRWGRRLDPKNKPEKPQRYNKRRIPPKVSESRATKKVEVTKVTMRSGCIEAINEAANFLKKYPNRIKILIKLSRNLGDTLHMIPVFKHYKLKYPNCVIAFLVEQKYASVHALNPDIDKLVHLPNDLNPQERLLLWEPIKALNGIDHKIAPAIHPFGAVHKSNVWSHENIATQVMYNAGIEGGKPLGGRHYKIHIPANDKRWAEQFFKNHKLNPKQCILFEYHSYSHPVIWKAPEWKRLIALAKESDISLIGLAGSGEGEISGMVDGRGLSWTKTVALANMVPKFIGVGSGNTMLAAGAENQPLILELGVPDSISISTCGYASSINLNGNITVNEMIKLVCTPTDKLAKTARIISDLL